MGNCLTKVGCSILLDIFGCDLLKIITNNPLLEHSCSEVQALVKSGTKLQSPKTFGFKCEDRVYSIMQSCWNLNPDWRPSFISISLQLEDYIREKYGLYNACWDATTDD